MRAALLCALAALALVLVLLSGCASEPLTGYAPLVSIVEAPARLVAPGTVTTLDNRVFVDSLAAFGRQYPKGSPERHALLLHERIHAERQDEQGPEWLARYVVDPSFRWEEEKLGWKVELEELRRAGVVVDAEHVASFLTERYTIAGRSMVGFQEAHAWVLATLERGP